MRKLVKTVRFGHSEAAKKRDVGASGYMKKSVLWGILTISLGVFGQERQWTEHAEIADLFKKAGITGCFIMLDGKTGNYIGYNQARARTQFIPASTFKIANSLIGLETAAVASVDQVLPYGGGTHTVKAWEKDMSLRQAIAISNVPVYQGLARKIGLTKMQQMVTRLGYGNTTIGTQVDLFWLGGPLKISAVEQVEFLNRLTQSALPIRSENQAAVREILLVDEKTDWQLYGKTGWTTQPDPDTGWFIGWVNSENTKYHFALNMDVDSMDQLKLRISLVRSSLKVLNLLP